MGEKEKRGLCGRVGEGYRALKRLDTVKNSWVIERKINTGKKKPRNRGTFKRAYVDPKKEWQNLG